MQGRALEVLWIGALLALVVSAALLRSSGVELYLGAKGLVLAWAGATVLLFTFRVKSMHPALVRAKLLGNGLMLMVAVSAAGALFSYWIVRETPFGYADNMLYRADRLLGFDWLSVYDAYRHETALHPYTQRIYLSIMHIPTVVVIGLALYGHEERLRRFILAFAASLAVTMIVFAFFPAVTPLFHLVGTHKPYIPATGVDYLPVIEHLRAAPHMTVEFHKLYGLVTFPSFHAASAVLFTWAAWSLRFWRWPVGLANLGMLVVTPIEGSHYLVDVVAGVLIAAAAIRLVCRAEQRKVAMKVPEPVIAA